MEVIARNVVIAGGEIDIVARDRGRLVAVEVRTSTGRDDPIDALDEPKRDRVSRLGSRIGASRVDLIGIGLGDEGVDVHWVPGRPR